MYSVTALNCFPEVAIVFVEDQIQDALSFHGHFDRSTAVLKPKHTTCLHTVISADVLMRVHTKFLAHLNLACSRLSHKVWVTGVANAPVARLQDGMMLLVMLLRLAALYFPNARVLRLAPRVEIGWVDLLRGQSVLTVYPG